MAVGIVFGAGGLVYRLKGAAQGSAGPVLPSPDVVRDPRILLLIAGVFVVVLCFEGPAHRLVQAGLGRAQAVLIIWSLAVVLGALAFI